jgi:hypothetical protein
MGLASFSVAGLHSLQQPTIAELVSRADSQSLDIPRIREVVEGVPLTELVQASTLILDGTLQPIQSYVSQDGRWIYTDYAVDTHQVMLDRKPAVSKTPGSRGIVMKVFGGTLVLNGITVRVSDDNIDYWAPGTRAILFLKESSDLGKYELVWDFVGVFEVTAAGIVPRVKPSTLFKTERGMSRPAFIAEVQRHIEDPLHR